MTSAESTASLRKTSLHAAHVGLGARMVAFAGYDMPVQYPAGTLQEHAWTREHASLFDVGHMGQANLIAADGRHETAAAALEAVTPADLIELAPGRQRYTQLLNDDGGTIDDLMVARTRRDGVLALVFNASRKDVDHAYVAARLPTGVRLDAREDRALLALQGPEAAIALERHAPGVAGLHFMQTAPFEVGERQCIVTRSGYSGEDGYEISVAATQASTLWALLLGEPEVRPAGLGARDTLRLEAGLPLYGHELDETVSPVEAGLAWSIGKRRRGSGTFPGASRILSELAQRPKRMRVGLAPEGRAPARDGASIQSADGHAIGIVTSGGYSPTLKKPIAMGFVDPASVAPGTPLLIVVRGTPISAEVTRMPFVAHRYRR